MASFRTGSSDDGVATVTRTVAVDGAANERFDAASRLALGTATGAFPDLGPSRGWLRDGDRDGGVGGTICIVVMGVSGTGKSTLGVALAETMGLPFIDGDDLHPAANVAKMSRGEPLDDGDRRPWLENIREKAVESVLEQLGGDRQGGVGPGPGVTGHEESVGRQRLGVIVACSSLKRAYRAVLRGEGVSSLQRRTLEGFSLPTYFVYLKGDREVLMARMLDRKGHFMKAGMLESQLNTLESPEGEPGVVTVSVEMSTEEQVVEAFRSLWL